MATTGGSRTRDTVAVPPIVVRTTCTRATLVGASPNASERTERIECARPPPFDTVIDDVDGSEAAVGRDINVDIDAECPARIDLTGIL